MFCGDFSTHVQGQHDMRWTDTGYVLAVEKNLYRWNDNTCEGLNGVSNHGCKGFCLSCTKYNQPGLLSRVGLSSAPASLVF